MSAVAEKIAVQEERFDKNGFATQETLDKLRARMNGVIRDQGIIVNDLVLAALIREIADRRELGNRIAGVLKAKGFAV
jgi:hypothetical protein